MQQQYLGLMDTATGSRLKGIPKFLSCSVSTLEFMGKWSGASTYKDHLTSNVEVNPQEPIAPGQKQMTWRLWGVFLLSLPQLHFTAIILAVISSSPSSPSPPSSPMPSPSSSSRQGLNYIARTALKLSVLLPQLPEYWPYRCVPPCLA